MSNDLKCICGGEVEFLEDYEYFIPWDAEDRPAGIYYCKRCKKEVLGPPQEVKNE